MIDLYKVYGHCATWTIRVDKDGFYTVAGKRFGDLCSAHRAIRIAEHRYLEAHPNAPVVNGDIWADHGLLWVEDIDGNYYN